MTAQFWTGVVFAAALVVFFMVAFFVRPNMTAGQWVILRVFAALCAACAAGLIVGEAVVSVTGDLGTTAKWSIYGTSGFAALILFWLTFPKHAVVLPSAVNVSIPDGVSFKNAANLIATQDNAVAKFFGFTDQELATPLNGGGIQGKTHIDIFSALGARGRRRIREYDVTCRMPIYELRVRK